MKFHPVPVLAALVAAAGLAWGVEPRSTQEPGANEKDSVTVTAAGEVFAVPTEFTLRASIEAKAEMAAEALDAFGASRSRAMEAFADSGLEGVRVAGGGMKTQYGPDAGNQMNMVIMSGQQPQVDNYVTCRESLHVTFDASPDVDARRAQVAAVIDAALDADLNLDSMTADERMRMMYYGGIQQQSPQAMLEGDVGDDGRTEHERKAEQKAIERARTLAGDVAELSGRTLGKVRRVDVLSVESSWEGIGKGRRFSSSLRITFDLD